MAEAKKYPAIHKNDDFDSDFKRSGLIMKKKVIACILGIALVMTLLSGCGNKDEKGSLAGKLENIKDTVSDDSDSKASSDEAASEEDKAEDTEKSGGDDKALKESAEGSGEEQKEKQEEEAGDDAAHYEEIYAPVLSEVYEVMDKGYDYDRTYKYISDGLMERAMYPGDDDLMKVIGYVIEDMSGDGIPELLVGGDEDYGEGPTSFIYSIFTVKDEKPFPVIEGWARSSHRSLGNGYFYYLGSGGVASTFMGEYRLSDNGQESVWVDFYFTDEKESGDIGTYHNTTGSCEAAESDEIDLPEDEFSRMMDDYEKRCVNISWTPIGDFDGGKEGKSGSEKSASHDYSYEGTVFTIDGKDMDVREEVPAVNAITDAYEVGDWIILDCHVNPHFGMYEFYNTNSGSFEYDIQGANLTWRDDDLSTAVYSMFNEVYDFWGHPIGWVNEGEVYGVKWIDDKTVGAECWIVDEKGNEDEFTEKYECEPHDKAVLSYYEYLLGGDKQWEKLTNNAPGNAVALVIVNPPERILDKLPRPIVYDKDAYDRVVVVSLEDGLSVHIEPGSYASEGSASGRKHEINKGEAVVYQVTVPEGLPNGSLVVSSPIGDEVSWDIIQISGKSPVMSEYLTAY